MDFNWQIHPHRRFNPLLGEWVLVSPQRTSRPWQGSVESNEAGGVPAFDPTCYLCPGNERAGGIRNPRYTSTFVFDNDFPALLPDTPTARLDRDDLLVAESEEGVCRVGCFSPRHDLTLSGMSVAAITEVVEMWTEQYAQLGALPFIRHVQIFENRGQMMGASNPHPHCQIWASSSVPRDTLREVTSQRDYQRRKESCLLCDYLAVEKSGERMVCKNDGFAAMVPFWAVWPYETIVIPRRHAGGLDELSAAERMALAGILRELTSRYDSLFGIPFPYSMGFHQRPTDEGIYDTFHLHAHFFPPLLRSATVKKFMVGYEMLAESQRDFTPEMAAERLRSVSSKRE